MHLGSTLYSHSTVLHFRGWARSSPPTLQFHDHAVSGMVSFQDALQVCTWNCVVHFFRQGVVASLHVESKHVRETVLLPLDVSVLTSAHQKLARGHLESLLLRQPPHSLSSALLSGFHFGPISSCLPLPAVAPSFRLPQAKHGLWLRLISHLRLRSACASLLPPLLLSKRGLEGASSERLFHVEKWRLECLLL